MAQVVVNKTQRYYRCTDVLAADLTEIMLETALNHRGEIANKQILWIYKQLDRLGKG